MKRQELKALLHGVENSGEIIDQIMEINGADIENARKNAETCFYCSEKLAARHDIYADIFLIRNCINGHTGKSF